jgi:hypothetical protein
VIDPEVERELASVTERFQRELASYKALTDQRDDARLEALKVALSANEKRLDTMNEFRQALSDQGGRMVTRLESESAIDVIAERVEQNRVTFEARVEAITRPKWTFMASVFSISLVLITGVWVLIGLKVDATVSPVGLVAREVEVKVNADTERLHTLETISATSTQADVASRGDRSQLNDRLRAAETLVASNAGERRSQVAAMNAKLVEIETQFCASDIVRNLTHADDMRLTALMWAKLYPGEKLPTDNAFYPRICNRVSTPDQSGQ